MVNTAIIAVPKQISFPKDIIKSKVKWFHDEHSTLIQLPMYNICSRKEICYTKMYRYIAYRTHTKCKSTSSTDKDMSPSQ